MPKIDNLLHGKPAVIDRLAENCKVGSTGEANL